MKQFHMPTSLRFFSSWSGIPVRLDAVIHNEDIQFKVSNILQIYNFMQNSRCH